MRKSDTGLDKFELNSSFRRLESSNLTLVELVANFNLGSISNCHVYVNGVKQICLVGHKFCSAGKKITKIVFDYKFIKKSTGKFSVT